MIYSKERASPGKASRPWGFSTCRTLHKASTIFQKECQKSNIVWTSRKWRIASSLSLSEQTKAGSNHWQNIGLNQIHSFVLLVTGVCLFDPHDGSCYPDGFQFVPPAITCFPSLLPLPKPSPPSQAHVKCQPLSQEASPM